LELRAIVVANNIIERVVGISSREQEMCPEKTDPAGIRVHVDTAI
jgi:hypothetical protein